MGNLKRVKVKLIKTDSGEFYFKDKPKFEIQLDNLSPGIYEIIIEKQEVLLSKMKKYYFLMEDKLAEHLGMDKKELHESLKSKFTTVNSQGLEVYESMEKIKDEKSMMRRIYNFQEYAAMEHNYTIEPFNEQ